MSEATQRLLPTDKVREDFVKARKECEEAQIVDIAGNRCQN